MQRSTMAPTTHEPVIAIRLWDVGVVIGAIIVVVAGHAMLAGALPWLLGLVVIVIPAYGAYRVWDYHHERVLFREARLERYRAETAQLTWLNPDYQGNYPTPYDAKSGQVVTVTPGNILQPVPQSITYSPHYAPSVDYRMSGKEQLAQIEAPAVAGLLPFPAPFSLKDIIKQQGVSVDRIFLAMARGDKPLFCDIDNYMHIAQTGPTGSGKTTQWRAEMALLLKAGVMAYLVNPHFAPIVMKRGQMVEDWRPIGAALERQSGLQGEFPALIYDWEEIARFLRFLVLEVDRRMEARRRMEPYGSPIYAFIDEWPGIVDWGRKHKDGRGKPIYDCGGDLAQIIRRGRAVEVFVSLNSQGFNVQEIGISGAARENFQTAYFLGGDPVSAAAMLDIKQTEFKQLCADLAQQDGLALGKGVAFFRNGQVSPDVQAVRLALADDEFLYYLFGHEDHWSLPDRPDWIEKGSDIISTAQPHDEMSQPQIEMRAAARGETVAEFLETRNVSGQPDELSVKAAAVSAETKRHIKRLVEKTPMAWGTIAEQVGLGGEKYQVFKAVCADMGYDTAVRRGGRKGGQS